LKKSLYLLSGYLPDNFAEIDLAGIFEAGSENTNNSWAFDPQEIKTSKIRK
jgi:hypothetical protein